MKVLIIGQSSIAVRRVIPALEKLQFISEIQIASNRDIDLAIFNKKLKYTAFRSYEEALKKSDAKIVYISLHNSAHKEWAEKSINIRKHVIVDKPAFTSLHETKNMLELADAKGVCLAEANVFSEHPQVKYIQEYVEYDEISRLLTVFSIPPLPFDNYRNHKELGGGAFLDLAPYAAASSRIFINKIPASYDCKIISRHAKTGVDTSFSILITYEGGKSYIGHFGFDTEYQNYLKAFGQDIAFSVNRIFTPPADFNNVIKVTKNNNIKNINVESADSFCLFFNRLYEAIYRNKWEDFTQAIIKDAIFINELKKSYRLKQ